MKLDKLTDVGFYLIFVELRSGFLTARIFISVSRIWIPMRANKKDKRTRKPTGSTTISKSAKQVKIFL